MGNEPVRQLKYDNSIGFADYISFLTLSKDSRYVIAGFQNSYDGNANFIIFDLTQDASGKQKMDPKILAMDAQAEVGYHNIQDISGSLFNSIQIHLCML